MQVRVHTDLAPVAVGMPRRHFAARINRTSTCDQITDRDVCCGSVDQDVDVCVPASTAFSNGKVGVSS